MRASSSSKLNAVQAGHAIGNGIFGRQHDDGDITGRAQPPAHLQPVNARQHDVQDDEVGRGVTGHLQAVFSIHRDIYRVAFVEQATAQQVGNLRFIFDNKDSIAHVDSVIVDLQNQAPAPNTGHGT